ASDGGTRAAPGSLLSVVSSADAARVHTQATTSVAATVWRFIGPRGFRILGGSARHHAPAARRPLAGLRRGRAAGRAGCPPAREPAGDRRTRSRIARGR